MICRIRKLEAEPTEVEGCDASACLQRPFPTESEELMNAYLLLRVAVMLYGSEGF